MDHDPSAAAPSAYAYPLIIRQLLHTTLTCGKGREIVYRDLHRYDYTTFLERVHALASGFHSLGIRHGDTVAVMDWDSHRYLECFFAAPMMGAVLHTINIRLAPEQILYTINHADDDVILVHDDFAPMLEHIRDRIERDVRIVRLTDGNADWPEALDVDVDYETLVADADPGHAFEDFDENTRATTFYTTGTTGTPKGVFFTHRQLVLHTLGMMTGLGWTGGHARFHRDDVYMPITPLFHVHGWGIPYVATLMGVQQVYPGRYEPENLLRLIDREGVTFSHCVPTILHMLLSHPLAEEVDLSNWKVVIGGSALPKGLARRALALGIDVVSAYGLSETCPLLTIAQLEAERLALPVERQLDIRCTTGRPTPLVEVRVVDENGDDVAHDGKTTGEVVTRAPWLTMSYFKEPELGENLWRGGYLHTGDIATMNGDGFLQITDRLKDVIKSGGEWISSLELETLVSQLDGVAEVAAIGIPHEKWGERPFVLIVPTDPPAESLRPEAVQAHLRACAERGEISTWAVPEEVRLVDAIDKTSVGKIDKKALRDRYGSP
jgi:fatty-acyl-CoA synthase